jgi:hypothetical protein
MNASDRRKGKSRIFEGDIFAKRINSLKFSFGIVKIKHEYTQKSDLSMEGCEFDSCWERK